MMRIVIIVSPPPHLRRSNRTLDARHRFQHPLEGVAVQTHPVLPVHVLSALGLAPPVADVVVEHIVMVSVADHVHVGVVDGFRVGEDVVLPQRRTSGSRGRFGCWWKRGARLGALGFGRFDCLGLGLSLGLANLK